ncbi:Hypothetical predicted protein [Octopus vulgaris]|uniref:Uncharacterized protein n=1 Tax=Octopus vulgaris TaxID=6645 RepID=A0AA36BJF7_OCTVU|nr:Hypothetical predicted protein [Octopus vulgaris]
MSSVDPIRISQDTGQDNYRILQEKAMVQKWLNDMKENKNGFLGYTNKVIAVSCADILITRQGIQIKTIREETIREKAIREKTIREKAIREKTIREKAIREKTIRVKTIRD